MPRKHKVHFKSNRCNIILPVTTRKMNAMSLLVVIIGLVIWPMLSTDAAKTPSPVFVNKCCRIGEKLERSKECSFGGSNHWWPLIWMIMKSAYFEPHSDSPRFFKVTESSRPRCQSPELIIGEHSFVVFSNGSLFLPDRNELFESDNFCIDKDMALVCSAQAQIDNSNKPSVNRTRVQKCCPQKAIYQTETDSACMTLRGGHEIIGRKLLENSTNPLEYRYGFPKCSKSMNNIAIVGKFNESKFDESTGNLTLAEGTFQQDQYCLEHFNDTGMINVHVFTCTEFLSISEYSEKVR